VDQDVSLRDFDLAVVAVGVGKTNEAHGFEKF
jgi:hypothetical protein